MRPPCQETKRQKTTKMGKIASSRLSACLVSCSRHVPLSSSMNATQCWVVALYPKRGRRFVEAPKKKGNPFGRFSSTCKIDTKRRENSRNKKEYREMAQKKGKHSDSLVRLPYRLSWMLPTNDGSRTLPPASPRPAIGRL